jgi:cytochrome c2
MSGPNLAGLIGRKVGSDPAFDYSPALRKGAR